MKKIVDSGFILGLFTAFLFALSTANYNGFLTGIGVKPSFIIRSSHQILYNALFVILIPLLKGLMWLLLIILCLRLFAFFYTAIIREFYITRKLIIKIRRFFYIKYTESKFEKFSSGILDRTMPAFLLFIALLISLSYAEHQGKERAKDVLNKLEKGSFLDYETVKLKDHKKEIYIISCGINNCAGIDLSSKDIVYFENKFEAGKTFGKIKPLNNQ